MRHANRSAFTLVELLTVIAIIAVLSALLFPVMSKAKEAARQTACLTNMQQIHTKLSLYHQDYDAYPPMLLGVAERSDGSAWQIGDPAPPVAAANVRFGFLYPAYVKSVSYFTCPDAVTYNATTVTQAGFPANSGYAGSATYGSHGLRYGPAGTPISYYAVDSYDATPGPNGSYWVAYTRDWSGVTADTQNDNPYQLKFNNPAPDKTVVTWCNAHVTVAHTEMCPVLLLSGTAKQAPANKVQSKGWLLGSD